MTANIRLVQPMPEKNSGMLFQGPCATFQAVDGDVRVAVPENSHKKFNESCEKSPFENSTAPLPPESTQHTPPSHLRGLSESTVIFG